MEIVPIFEITMLIWFCWENPGVNNYFINVFFGHNNGAIRSYFKKIPSIVIMLYHIDEILYHFEPCGSKSYCNERRYAPCENTEGKENIAG